MDELSASVIALILWRLVLSALVAVALAALLLAIMPGASPLLAVAIVLLGVGAGIVWQSKATFPSSASVQQAISRPVAFLGLTFAGVFWGGIIEFATGSPFVAAALLIATPALSSPVIVAATKSALSLRQLVFATIACVAGYAIIYAIHGIASSTGS